MLNITVDGEQEINENSLTPISATIEAVTTHENLHVDTVIGSTWIKAGVKLVWRLIKLTRTTSHLNKAFMTNEEEDKKTSTKKDHNYLYMEMKYLWI